MAVRKDGWRHIYKIDMNGKETLITKDAFDVIKPEFLMFLIS